MQITGRILRLHLAAYSSLTLLLTLGLVAVVAWFPLNRRISASVEQSLRHETELRVKIVDETIRRASEAGWQVSSRTSARADMAEADRGLVSAQEVTARLLPKLRDAVEFSTEIHGLLRLNSRGEVLLRIGPAAMDTMIHWTPAYSLRDQPPIRFITGGRQGLSRIFHLGNEPHVLVFTPVYSPDQREVGMDLLLFRLSSLAPTLLTPLAHGGNAKCMLLGRRVDDGPVELLMQMGKGQSSFKNLSRNQDLGHLLNSKTHYTVDAVSDLVLCASPLASNSWWLLMAAPKHEMLRESRIWLISILLSILVLGLVGLGGSLILMRPLSDKILVAQEDLRRQVVELEKVHARLESQSEALELRNEDLRHFAYATAHDLKSPLISIGGHAQMLLERLGPELSQERRMSLEFILSGAKRMHQHVNDMLDYSRAAEIAPRYAKVSLDRLCREIISSLDGRIRESQAKIMIQVLPEITSDRRLLRMVLFNLIDNALCYRQQDRVPEVRVEAEFAHDELVIRVQDNGLGIAPAHQPQIFESFYRLHDEAKIPGTGLGLAICLRAVRRLEGTIELDSEPGQGSCFTVRLPQPPESATTEADEETPLA